MAGNGDIECDVVVIGSGLAGLSAAWRLHRVGQRVHVLEARDEVGGRALTRDVGGERADLGGEWLGRAHRRLVRLAREFDLQVEPARNAGRPALWRLPDGESLGLLPPPHVWPGLVRTFATAAWQSRGISAEAPWTSPRAVGHDRRSVAEWLDHLELHPDAGYLLERILGAAACGRLEEMSLLQLLWLLQVAGGPLRSANAGFQWRITGGAQQIPLRIADRLGNRVRTGVPCRGLTQDGRTVVAMADDRVVRAARAIVAVPVTQLLRIRFDPPLTSEQAKLTELHIGAGVKVIGVLPTGHTVRHNTVVGGPVLWGAWRRGNRVTGFAPSTIETTDDALTTDLAAAFRIRRDDLQATTVFRWDRQDHIQGCDTVFAPGQITALGPHLTRPQGLIAFAGAERSS